MIRSMFRYPGNKKKLAPTISQYIPCMDYWESCVGGGSLLLSIADKYKDIKLYVGDIDPGIIDFWNIMSSDDGRVELLIQEINDVVVDLPGWEKINKSEPSAFRFLFLCMTSFSGMIHTPGPIGGRKNNQEGKTWKVDTLWNPDKFIRMIRQYNELLKGRLDARCENTFKSDIWDKDVFIYLDPPYVKAGKALYGIDFDHERLSEKLRTTSNHWILSYDVHDWVRDKYKDFHIIEVVGFSGNKHEKQNELLISNKPFEADQYKLF